MGVFIMASFLVEMPFDKLLQNFKALHNHVFEDALALFHIQPTLIFRELVLFAEAPEQPFLF